MTAKKQVTICGVRIDNVTMEGTLDAIECLIKSRQPAYVVTPNADHMVKLQKDEEFRRIYEGASLVLADGMPILWAGLFLGTPLAEKVSGSDLVPKLCRRAAEKNFTLFFLGGREGAAARAKEVLEKKYPGLCVVGTYSPPVGFEKDAAESRKIEEMIRAAAPDVLLVGLGAPKQEKWISKNHQALAVPVSVGVGVTFEFIAGMVKRAPRWMQATGLEWSWRLLMEPKRLWKRYLVDDTAFFWFVFRQKLSRRK